MAYDILVIWYNVTYSLPTLVPALAPSTQTTHEIFMSDETTITCGRTTFTVIPLESSVEFSLALKKAGKGWHSHVLSPGCSFNPYPEKYALVVEDDVEHRAYIAPSDEFPEEDKALVKLLHGDDILDPNKTVAVTGATNVKSEMLDRLREIDNRGTAWHHHMNFPGCMLSPEPNRWTITIESDEGMFFESYDTEPIDVLREVEVIYFRNLENRCRH